MSCTVDEHDHTTPRDLEPAMPAQHFAAVALHQGIAVGVYGQVFDDGGADGKGIHETHYDRGRTNEDGALAVYRNDARDKPRRTWFLSSLPTTVSAPPQRRGPAADGR